MRLTSRLSSIYCIRAIALIFALCGPGFASAFEYSVKLEQVAPDTWVSFGKREYFSPQNGGAIVNVGVIRTGAGVIIVNSGPSLAFGLALKKSIAAITDEPVVRIYNSKQHPDHFFGNQAFSDVPTIAHPLARAAMRREGNDYLDNLYRVCGDALKGTELTVASEDASAGVFEVGSHKLEVRLLSGHTPGDLVIIDHTTGVLFAGGIVFHEFTPTTPHANLPLWQAELDTLQAMPFKLMIPSHGLPSKDDAAVRQTRDYLGWLNQTLRAAAERGLDATDLLGIALPARFGGMANLRPEFVRSLAHLFPRYERAALAAKGS
jgi:quinoprotein relay system zinc metallohydrolase 1